MARQPDFFRQMNEQLLEQLEEYAREPGRYGTEVLQWLTERGVKTSRSAVYNWFEDWRMEERNRRATDMARDYLAAAKAADPTAVSEAALMKFEELVLEHLMSAESGDAGELMKIAVAMKTGAGTRRELLELKQRGNAELDKLKKAATAKRQITAEDIENVRKKVFG
ncbi:MAG: phage protein Gp27 family protein [Tepidisphaeraceae bacterium]